MRELRVQSRRQDQRRRQLRHVLPHRYEAQVNSSHKDPVRTGSLYGFVKIYDMLVPPDTWFNQHIIADGNHIIIEVNGKKVVDYVDTKNTHTEGYLALQQHNKGSV